MHSSHLHSHRLLCPGALQLMWLDYQTWYTYILLWYSINIRASVWPCAHTCELILKNKLDKMWLTQLVYKKNQNKTKNSKHKPLKTYRRLNGTENEQNPPFLICMWIWLENYILPVAPQSAWRQQKYRDNFNNCNKYNSRGFMYVSLVITF